jgi:hypothetical protein
VVKNVEISCLVVSRHNLLYKQAQDIELICQSFNIIPALPTEPEKLKDELSLYTAVVGNLPIPLITQILQLKKNVYTFKVENMATVTYKDDYETEKQKVLEQYENMKNLLIVQDPDLKTKTFRVSKYSGLQKIVKIDIVTEEITKW